MMKSRAKRNSLQPVCCQWLINESQDVKETHQFLVVQATWDASRCTAEAMGENQNAPSISGLRSFIMQHCYCAYLEHKEWFRYSPCMSARFAELSLEILIFLCSVMWSCFTTALHNWRCYSILASSLQHSSVFPASTPSGLSDDPQSVSPSPSYMWSSNAPPRYSPPYFPPFEKPPPYTP